MDLWKGEKVNYEVFEEVSVQFACCFDVCDSFVVNTCTWEYHRWIYHAEIFLCVSFLTSKSTDLCKSIYSCTGTCKSIPLHE